jgi:phosphatidate cytidylyltransferase
MGVDESETIMQQSYTELPVMENTTGKPQKDYTFIPSSLSSSSSSSSAPTAEETKEPAKTSGSGVVAPRKAMSGAQVSKDESRAKKITTRVVSGAGMIAVFCGCVYMGPLYLCMIVALSEFLLFRELVKVRYNTHFHTIEDTIPLFRTTQWTWFGVAIFYTYGDFVSDVIIQNNSELHYLWPYSKYMSTISFALYSACFVLTISTMQVGHIKFQLNQLCWSIVVLCLTVGQMKYIMHNIFNGLFWFTFPFLLVVVNDIMAYFAGITCGRKFIRREFISFSPNKTWEGFIGGGIFTMIAAWYMSRALAQYPWMTCPANSFHLIPQTIECENHHIFLKAQSIFPPQIFELFPTSLVKMYVPGIVEICADRLSGDLHACVSGEPNQSFHHFELVLKNVYPIQIHALWLAFFASVVGPFGGFLASAIKRAYGIKDFDSFIPGHGGVTDRLDCQFLMALCTWVHYNTFVKMATVSVPKLVYMYHMLSESEQKDFVEVLRKEKAF